ncbi:MAG: efflux RND transporter periplasmic adaptor subunit [Vicinamibacteria bacterium]|nr:efflux RND transporter periplasmic adaptor subunit [Vicinamibacteria bacterium]
MHPSHRRRTRLVCGLALIAASVACGGARPAAVPGPVEVTTVTVQPERVVLTTELPGRTAPYLVAEIRPRVNGLIQERAFEEGADVRKGSLLYRIDPAPYQSAYEQAKAALAVAEANLPAARSLSERLAGLAAISAVGQQDADNAAAALARAEAAADSARAVMESARIQLAYTPLEAPISGRIGRSAVTVGALVAAYQPVPLAVIQQLDPIYVDVTQSSAELLKLRRALASGALTSANGAIRKARLVLEDGTPYAHEGRLQFRDVTVDPTTGSVTLRMVFPNPELVLLPGMYVRAVIEEAAHEAAILAPQQGVTRNPQGVATALVIGADGTAQERQLEVDRAIGDRWLVTKGLAAGDRVIVEGQQRIRPGAPVKEAPTAAPAK